MNAEIPALMSAADEGNRSASEALFAALYSELHRIARRQLSRGGYGVTLGATSLLHEAYVDIAARGSAVFPDRNRFMAYASRVMRGLVIDYARQRQARKRGGQFELTSLQTDLVETAAPPADLQHVSDALDRLAELDPVLAEVIDLKFFCGFSFAEIAAMHGVCERTVQRNWQKARAYLHRALQAEGDIGEESDRAAPRR